MKEFLRQRLLVMGAVTTIVIAVIALMVLAAGGIVAWEYSNSDSFCANTCHSVHPEETLAHNVSFHAQVRCVECHIGRLPTLQVMALKPEHAKELWGMIVGYERPLVSTTLRPARQNCEGCHNPSVVHHDSIVVKKHYDTDAASSENATRLTLHTGFGAVRDRVAKGIHWHVTNDVEFAATDPQRRTIPWVRVMGADGKTTTYVDATAKAGSYDPNNARRMECFDCHNAVGHPFPNPLDAVDDAIATGRIDRALPSAKARAVTLVDNVEKTAGPYEERAKLFDRLIAESAAKAQSKPENKQLEAKFEREMKRILLASTFEAQGITWKTFPNHTGHKDFAGCFRCHDGKHFDDKGNAIRLQCTLCHDLPQVTREKGKGSVPSTIATGLEPPESHEAPNWMHEHRLSLDSSCAACHGKTEFGRDGGNFCANPACHGRTWPEMNLNVEAKAAPTAQSQPPGNAEAKATAKK
jgi:nitrate/TMAO reductase-like tetraheme cytochrome c subunit